MCVTYLCFLAALLAADTGWDRDRYEQGVLEDWQLDQKAGGPVERWFPGYASWDDLSGEEWKAMAYRSADVLGRIGYRFDEKRLVDLGYYQDAVFYGAGAQSNTWDGTWTGKNGVASLDDFKTEEAQTSAVQEAFGYDLRLLNTQLAAYGRTLDDFIGEEIAVGEPAGDRPEHDAWPDHWRWHSYRHGGREDRDRHWPQHRDWSGDDRSSVKLTLSGILAANHLRGPFSTAAFLLEDHRDGGETQNQMLQVLEMFGGYDTPEAGDLMAAFSGQALGVEGLGSLDPPEILADEDGEPAPEDVAGGPVPDGSEVPPTACEGGGIGALPGDCSGAAGLWQPQVGDSWQWQLQGDINETYDAAIYDVDLFTVPAETIGRLQAHGVRVLCYFSAGSSEDWRPDFGAFQAADMGNPLDGWPGERWLDIRSDIVRTVMSARIRLAAEKGCDGVEPDNVDGFEPDNRAGFDLTADNQLDFNRFLADEAHRAGLAVALKNNVAQVPELAASFDLAVNEQCHQYDECEAYSAFTTLGKPVLNAEYAAAYRTDAGKADLCAQASMEGLSTLILPLELDDSFRIACTD